MPSGAEYVVPSPWLWVSGVSFAMSILLNLALIVGAIMAWGKIKPVLDEARHQISRIGDRAYDITTTAKKTVDTVQDRTEKILGTAQQASAKTTHNVSVITSALTGAFVLTRVIGYIRGLSQDGKSHNGKRAEVTVKTSA